ncbi:hypothetical protein INT45_002459 [Circinella minor]|uniref:Yeast cell wall synthesis Kre9/Knh1-like N-terminal domain-containing protein n=1 Tax=Circinella minor TaxID=1195481 RepID=A0A8H7SCJ7_9FUNG|nr:hypothetical protein INT45_002459 [Circinella minor]
MFVGFVSSQTQGDAGIAINAPARGTVWNAGKTEQVAWTVHDNTVSEIQTVELRQGGSANLQIVGVVGSNLPVSGATGQWQWNIPVDTKTDASYVLVFKSNKGETYSDYFTIMAADPATIASASSAAAAASANATSSESAVETNGSEASTIFNRMTLSLVGLSIIAATGTLLL